MATVPATCLRPCHVSLQALFILEKQARLGHVLEALAAYQTVSLLMFKHQLCKASCYCPNNGQDTISLHAIMLTTADRGVASYPGDGGDGTATR